MSPIEARVLVDRLAADIAELASAHRDLIESDVPQHVLEALASPIRHIEKAAAEIRRLHGVNP